MKFIRKIFFRYKTRFNEDIDYAEVEKMIKTESNIFLIDVRSKQEYEEYHLPGSINISVYEISKKIENILKNKDTIIILYCQSGSRSRKALEKIKKLGYKNLYNLKGGIEAL